jgi:glutaredoxin
MKEVVIYSLSTCQWCRKAKKYFDERNVAYDNTDYDLVDTAEQARVEKDMRDLEVGGFPVVKIGHEVVVGYRPEQYDELLR